MGRASLMSSCNEVKGLFLRVDLPVLKSLHLNLLLTILQELEKSSSSTTWEQIEDFTAIYLKEG